MENDYIEVMDAGGLAERKLTPISFAEQSICLLKLGQIIYAFGNVCGHVGGRISDGWVGKDTHVICPIHKAIFDVSDGSGLSTFAYRGLKIYPVRIEGGKILIGKESLKVVSKQ